MNEEKLKKEIEKLKNKVYNKLGTKKCPDEDYKDDEKWEELYDGNLISLNTQLKTLQERNAEVKQAIEEIKLEREERKGIEHYITAGEFKEELLQKLGLDAKDSGGEHE